MGKGTARFLNISLVLASVFCIIIFACQAAFMNLMGTEAIRQLGVFYMSGITEQVSSHFETIIELRLSQVQSILYAVPPERASRSTSMQFDLSYNARSAGFEYLAFYTQDGQCHMIYGLQVTPDLPEALRESVQGGKNSVCAGTDKAGTPVVLIGVPAHYQMRSGETSVALVAGLPTSYLSDTLKRDIQDGIIEYSIIRNDGSYVLHNSNVEESNYFDRIDRLYEPYGGKNPEQYAKELREALEADEDYTSEALIAGERWNIYCTTLPNSDWHLLLKTSHSTLDETVHLLQRRWSFLSLSGCALIVTVLLLIFAGYYRLTKLQMKELDEARKTAEQAQKSAERSNRAKSEFLSNISHDIRTPMNGIMGMTSIAIDSLDDPPRVRTCLKKIHVSSRHLLGLITDMLDMSKIESGRLSLNMEPLSIREIMQNTTTIIQPQLQEKNQQFSV
ncbi:MAG: response regulator, partial [Oscillospiraceae bacterium]|nr:response regulator [Oscillospiraceae bacterium]